MKKGLMIFLMVFIASSIAFAYYFKNRNNDNFSENLDGDRDQYGCITSAGYSWCVTKQKCLRTWEEKCEEEVKPTMVENDSISDEIKKELVAKHGQGAEKLIVKVSKVEGDYVQGGASEVGVGGGMWFAAKIDGQWNLVWDGNGIIACESLVDVPDFPTSMIPECYDEINQKMIVR